MIAKKVKLKNDNWVYNLSKGYVFDVEAEDDGFYSLNDFYGGYVINNDGLKMWITIDQDQCEIVEFC